ncbi:MAG: PQQ-binding-like beta-propeller repeat protein [Chlorobi bacterium]|nr:PQQ-binding-like beta-propeller repeat protein [Chlorobiota bacterium]MCI0716822.1 PQQ-binding-like beta-propeller repeat protein [Chlorobiota bacterium]
MSYKTFFILIIASGLTLFSHAQVSEEWVARYHPSLSQNDYGNDMELDESGNIYVVGITKPPGNEDNNWVIIKYSQTGNMLWNITYNGPYSNGADEAISVALSNSQGCIYVTGFIRPPNAGPRSIVTKKITFSGTEVWSKTYNSNDDMPYKIALSPLGNIFVAGRTNTSGVLIKYNQNGDSLWVKNYNYNNLQNSGLVDFCIDQQENVYAISGSGNNPIILNFITTKFSSNGQIVWEKEYDGPANNNDEPGSIGMDNSGNLYVAGKSKGNGTHYDFTVISYDNNGTLRWVSRISSSDDDEALDLFVDSQSRVYAVGYVSTSESSSDFLTVKYSSTGSILWQKQFNNPFNSWDIGECIIVDNSFNVYVTGKSGRPPLQLADYNTLKYNQNGDLQWSMNYNGLLQGVNEDIPKKIALDISNNVYVTGHSVGENANDVCTIKYSSLVGINPVSSEIPKYFNLYQNYPNPFNPKTKIKFDLPVESFTLLKIFDAIGKEISTLVNENLKAGKYELLWNPAKQNSGVYFCKLTTEGFTQTKKMVLLK